MSGRDDGAPAGQPAAVALLEAHGLHKAFPTGRSDALGRRRHYLRAVDGVDLRVGEGEVHGLVGESGCGKSTLGRLLLGLIETDRGSIHFMGRSVAELARKNEGALRSGMQVVFQNPFSSLNPRLSLGSTLREALRVSARRTKAMSRTEVAQRVVAAMAEVGLARELLVRFPRELSGGQLQRVGIARALLVGPKLLVADEPLSSLDLSVQAQILNLLAGLRESRGLAMLLISHDLRVIEHVADRVSVMYLGRIVETGPTDEVFRRPRHPYTRALIAAAPDPYRAELGRRAKLGRRAELGRQAEVGRGVIDAVSADSSVGCRFAPRCPYAMPRCAKEEPGLLDAAGKSLAACWLVEEPGAAPV